MAGFLTSQQQQLQRRLIRALPLRCLVYLAAALAWALSPEFPPLEAGTLRGEMGWILGMLHIAAVEFGFAALTEGAWGGPRWARSGRSMRRWLLPFATVLYGAMAATAICWTLALESPMPLIGVQVIVALMWWWRRRSSGDADLMLAEVES